MADTGRDHEADDEGLPTDEGDADSYREVGVEFGELAAHLEAHDYPATARELNEAYGEYELRYAGGSETFSATFGSLADTFESAAEVRQSVLNGVGQTAVGRKAYTDRGASALESDDTSF